MTQLHALSHDSYQNDDSNYLDSYQHHGPNPISTYVFSPIIIWEGPQGEFELVEVPVDNIDQPLLAEALRDALKLANLTSDSSLTASNLGLSVTINNNVVLKAPDWFYVPFVKPIEDGKTRKIYVPKKEGNIPAIVMEFLSNTQGTEYSTENVYPYGKWYFYEQILQVPWYVIFNPDDASLEVYRLRSSGYKLQKPNQNGHYWIPPVKASLGVWHGHKKDTDRTGYWLRWFQKSGKLLPWQCEQLKQERLEKEQAQLQTEWERQEKERERQEKERERQEKELAVQQIEKLMAQLRSLGVEPQTVNKNCL